MVTLRNLGALEYSVVSIDSANFFNQNVKQT